MHEIFLILFLLINIFNINDSLLKVVDIKLLEIVCLQCQILMEVLICFSS